MSQGRKPVMTMESASEAGKTGAEAGQAIDLSDTSRASATISPRSPGRVQVSCISAVPGNADRSTRVHNLSMHVV